LGTVSALLPLVFAAPSFTAASHHPSSPQITYYVDARDGSDARRLHYSSVMPYGQVKDSETQSLHDLTSWMTWKRQVRGRRHDDGAHLNVAHATLTVMQASHSSGLN
jgi:hypothetical protein